MSYNFPWTTHYHIVLVYINISFPSNLFDSGTFSYLYLKTESIQSFSEQENIIATIVLQEEFNNCDNKPSHINFYKQNWYHLEDKMLYIRMIQLEEIIERNNGKAIYQYYFSPNSYNIERKKSYLYYHMSTYISIIY